MLDERHRRVACPLPAKLGGYGAAVVLAAVPLCIGSPTARADESIVIDFVRHGQSAANVAGLIDTAVPGSGLTQTGQDQAQAVAHALAPEGPYAGLYAAQLIRTQETAAPLAQLLGMNVQVLPGLNEINAGIYEGLPQISPAGLLYLTGVIPWTLGLYVTPIPGSADANGVVFEDAFSTMLSTIYGNDMIDPTLSADGKITDVAFSSDFAIMIGTMMNVKNPDLLLMLTDPLPNAGSVVIQGSPADGWTLVSWNGVPVPRASLPIELFVDVRNLITAPQMAGYTIWQAVLSGDPTTLLNAIRDGFGEVAAGTFNFPVAVTQDIVAALPDSVPSLSTDLANLVPTAAADVGGFLAATVGDSLTPL